MNKLKSWQNIYNTKLVLKVIIYDNTSIIPTSISPVDIFYQHDDVDFKMSRSSQYLSKSCRLVCNNTISDWF